MTKLEENLTQARDCAVFTADTLRRSMGPASAVEALVLLPLIADAAKLAQQVAALRDAIAAESADEAEPECESLGAWPIAQWLGR